MSCDQTPEQLRQARAEYLAAVDRKYEEPRPTRGTRADRTVRRNDSHCQRNDPCPCGSGRKFKACCMNRPPAPADLGPVPRQDDASSQPLRVPREYDELTYAATT